MWEYLSSESRLCKTSVNTSPFPTMHKPQLSTNQNSPIWNSLFPSLILEGRPQWQALPKSPTNRLSLKLRHFVKERVLAWPSIQTCVSPQMERRKSLGQAWITSESLVQTRSGMMGILPSDSTPMACLSKRTVAERTNEWFAQKIDGVKTSFNQDSGYRCGYIWT